MTNTSSAKTDFVQPILILTAICLVCALLLASINGVTKPIIEATELKIAQDAMAEVLPEANGAFTQLDVELPSDSVVASVYEADNGSGYVFMVNGNGYGGKGTMKLITSLDPDGNIIATKTLAHAETAGMGSKTADAPWRDQFVGVNAGTLDTVDTISGATISSNHYLNSMRAVFEAYALVAG